MEREVESVSSLLAKQRAPRLLVELRLPHRVEPPEYHGGPHNPRKGSEKRIQPDGGICWRSERPGHDHVREHNHGEHDKSAAIELPAHLKSYGNLFGHLLCIWPRILRGFPGGIAKRFRRHRESTNVPVLVSFRGILPMASTVYGESNRRAPKQLRVRPASHESDGAKESEAEVQAPFPRRRPPRLGDYLSEVPLRRDVLRC